VGENGAERSRRETKGWRTKGKGEYGTEREGGVKSFSEAWTGNRWTTKTRTNKRECQSRELNRGHPMSRESVDRNQVTSSQS
jgi:hypothetical protein